VSNPATTLVNKHTHVSVWILLAALGGYGWLVQQLGAINTRLSVMESESALRAQALENRLGGLDQIMLKYGVEIEGLQRRVTIVEQAQLRETPERNK
jgi:hypothetical protein